MKTKNNDLKKQVEKLEKAQQDASKLPTRQKRESSMNSGPLSHRDERFKAKENATIDNNAYADAMSPELLQKLTQYNDLQEKLVNVQAFAAKTDSYNMVLLKQTSQQEQEIHDLRSELDDLLEKDIKDGKM